jgi:flagellar biogenesis protein FliO
MTSGKIKIVFILAAIVFAGGLLSAVRRVTATSSQQRVETAIPPMPGLAENDSNSPVDTGQSVVFTGGREMFYKMLLSALLIIALGTGAIYVSKKLLPRISSRPNKKIRVLETTHISPRKGLHLIQVGRRQLLIASTNEAVTMLADVTDPASDFGAQLEARISEK